MQRTHTAEDHEKISRVGIVGSNHAITQFLQFYFPNPHEAYVLFEGHRVEFKVISDFLLTDVAVVMVLIDTAIQAELENTRHALAQLVENQRGQAHKAVVMTVALSNEQQHRLISSLDIRDVLIEFKATFMSEINLTRRNNHHELLINKAVHCAYQSPIKHRIVKKNSLLEKLLSADQAIDIGPLLYHDSKAIIDLLKIINKMQSIEQEIVLETLQDMTPISLGDTLYQSRLRLRKPTQHNIDCRLQLIKAEIISTLLKFVFEHSQETEHYDLFVESIWRYGSKKDVGMLVDAAIKRPDVVTQARFPEYAGNVIPTIISWFSPATKQIPEARAEIKKIIDKQWVGPPCEDLTDIKELIVVAEPLSLLIGWMNEIKIAIDKWVPNKALFLQAIRNEHIQKLMIAICASIDTSSDLGALEKRRIYRRLELMQQEIRKEEIALSQQMLQRIQWLGVDVVKNIRSIDHDRAYECSFITQNQSDLMQAFVREVVTVDSVTVADLIKWMAYISKAGTAEQKLVLYKMQPGMLDDEIEAWLESGSPAVKEWISTMLRSNLLGTQRETLALKDIVGVFTAHPATEQLIKAVLAAYQQNGFVNADGFVALSEFVSNFKYNHSPQLNEILLNFLNLYGNENLLSAIALYQKVTCNAVALELLHLIILANTASCESLMQVMHSLCLIPEDKVRFVSDLSATSLKHEIVNIINLVACNQFNLGFLRNCEAIYREHDKKVSYIDICNMQQQACNVDAEYALLFSSLTLAQIAVVKQKNFDLTTLTVLFGREHKDAYNHFILADLFVENIQKLMNGSDDPHLIGYILGDVIALKKNCVHVLRRLSELWIPVIEEALDNDSYFAIHLRLALAALQIQPEVPQKVAGIIESTQKLSMSVLQAEDLTREQKISMFNIINNMLDHVCDINRNKRVGSLDECLYRLKSMRLNLKLRELWNIFLSKLSALIGVFITPARETSRVLLTKATLFSERAQSIAHVQHNTMQLREVSR